MSSVTGVSSTSSARNVTNWTVTTLAGMASRGKRTLRMSADWSSSDGAAESSEPAKNVHTTIPTSRNSG